MTVEFDFYSAFHHTNLVIQIPFQPILSSYPFCQSDTIFNPFWAFIIPILSFKFHFQPISGFHHTHFVIQMPHSTHFGLSSYPFCHSDTIFNPFWAFIIPTLSLRYHFQPILGFHHTHFVTQIPFSPHFGLSSYPFCH